ncbi:MAG: hypothetical protein DLD55_02970 [candidate division SR1 bacterium]|nr:MAG: hypothetical protein DLD55_02970 [candidate division SR1 bacterium]
MDYSNTVQVMYSSGFDAIQTSLFKVFEPKSVSDFFGLVLLLGLVLIIVFKILPQRNGNHYK